MTSMKHSLGQETRTAARLAAELEALGFEVTELGVLQKK
jgi:hypothetical protein